MIRYEKGSEWRRWDLHIHTPGTNKNDQFDGSTLEDKWTKYLASIKAYEQDIAVIGVTDYFSVENYFKMKEYFMNGKIDCGVECLIPNVELRCSPVTGKGNALNVHCLFDPDIDQEIERRFLGCLTFRYKQQNYSATRQDLIALGRAFTGNANLQEAGARKVGLEQFVVPFEALTKLFETDPKLRERCLLVVANGNDGASGVRNHYEFLDKGRGSALDATVKNIYHYADAVFSGHQADRPFFLGEKDDRHTPKVIREWYGTLMPCLHGCDAHESKKLFEPTGKKYCWIKADPSFNGLRQVIFEPKLRVHIGEAAPSSAAPRQTIRKLRLAGYDEIANEDITFSDNLTCIIGGRSTGKSVLLATIAKKMSPEAEVKKDNERYDEFVQQVAAGSEVVWADEEINDEREIEYFYQGYMEQFRRDQDKFDNLVRKIVTEGLEKDPMLEFDNFVAANKQQLLLKLTELFRLQSQQGEKLKEQKTAGDIVGIQKEIERLEAQRDQVRASQNFSEEDFTAFNKLQASLREVETAEATIQADKSRMEAFVDVTITVPSYIDLSEAAREVLMKAEKDALDEASRIWREALSKIQLKMRSDSETAKVQKEQITSEELYTRGVKVVESSSVLKELEINIGIQRKALETFNRVTEEITRLVTLESELRKEILELNTAYYKEAKRLSTDLTAVLSGGDLQIEAYPRVDDVSYNSVLQQGINLKSDDRKNAASFEFGDDPQASFTDHVVETFNQVLADNLKLKNQHTAPSFLRNVVADAFVSISFRITYEGDQYEQMSEGKQAFVILRLLLDNSEKSCPILIDQPEDDLDNRAIYTDLVSYIRNKKLERQIIVVTHNPNIVVGTDAELVLVANQNGVNSPNDKGAQFQYLGGSLEHSASSRSAISSTLEAQGIREHVCEILEGGVEAFRAREKRYRLR